MVEPTPTPRLRGKSLLVARIAALGVSFGVVALVAVNAGLGGCGGAQPEPEDLHFADDPAAPPRGSASAPGAERGGFMGGAKTAAGPWARPPEKPSPQVQAPQQAPAERGQYGFLGGSKVPAGAWADPPAQAPAQPPAQAPAAPNSGGSK